MITRNEVESEIMNREGGMNFFHKLKDLFQKEPLLHFNFDRDKTLLVNSLGYAIVGVLSQKVESGYEQPVSFYSQKLTDWERAWPIFDLELLAIVSAFQEWGP